MVDFLNNLFLGKGLHFKDSFFENCVYTNRNSSKLHYTFYPVLLLTVVFMEVIGCEECAERMVDEYEVVLFRIGLNFCVDLVYEYVKVAGTYSSFFKVTIYLNSFKMLVI